MSAAVEHVASNEDGIEWFARTCTPTAARREVAQLWAVHPRTLKVTAEHMRPATESDCRASNHGTDEHGDPADDDCTCSWWEEEGWRFTCAADHPDAIAVWRVEPSAPPLWWTRLRLLQRRTYHRLRPTHRPVLWGGRSARRATRVDRLLAGTHIGHLAGDMQLRLGETEMRWCRTCRMTTAHRGPYCCAEGHWTRRGSS